MNPQTRPGDVIRVTKFNGENFHGIGLVTEAHAVGGAWVEWLIGGHNDETYVARSLSDRYTIVPPEEWTSNICRAVALFQLTGELR
jgi:hypothetical protein